MLKHFPPLFFFVQPQDVKRPFRLPCFFQAFGKNGRARKAPHIGMSASVSSSSASVCWVDQRQPGQLRSVAVCVVFGVRSIIAHYQFFCFVLLRPFFLFSFAALCVSTASFAGIVVSKKGKIFFPPFICFLVLYAISQRNHSGIIAPTFCS